MKTVKWFVSIVAAVAMVAMVGCSSGCSSTKPARTAYVASGVTHVTVASALRGWNDYLGREYASIAAEADPVKASKRREDLLKQEAQVKAAHEKYQASQLAVLTAAQEFSKIPPKDPNAPAAQDRLNAAVNASAATLAQVVTLLESFGVEVK